MTPIVLNVSIEEAERLTKRAHDSGYETVEAYLRALVENDMEEDEEDDKAKLHADFKEAFKDALRGKFYTREEFNRMMEEDD